MALTNYCVSLLIVIACSASSLHATQPNIVFVLADDMGYNDIGFSPKTDVRTPFIDELARESLILKHSYTHFICTPSRAALMTGKYAYRYGLQQNAIRETHPEGLDLSLKLLPKYLKEEGYRTHLVGKWHLGACKKEYTPTHRGFDTFRGILGGHTGYYDHVQSETGLYDYWENDKLLKSDVYCTDDYADYATDLIEKEAKKNKPMFLLLSLQAVHAPLEAPPHSNIHHSSSYREVFKAMVTTVDQFTEKMVNALKKADIWDNTVFAFSSDNGGIPRMGGNNYPLRGVKHTLWEGGNRVRSFVRGPDIKPGEFTGLFHVVDWLPTFVKMAGGSVKDKIDGVDQSEAFRTNPEHLDDHPRTSFFYNVNKIEKHDKCVNASAMRYRVKHGSSYKDYKLILGKPGPISSRISPSYKPTEEDNELLRDREYFSTGVLYDMKVSDEELEEDPLPLKGNEEVKEHMLKMIQNEYNYWVAQEETEETSSAFEQVKHGTKYLGPGWC